MKKLKIPEIRYKPASLQIGYQMRFIPYDIACGPTNISLTFDNTLPFHQKDYGK